MDSDSEGETEPKCRKLSKSKNGKGVKKSKKTGTVDGSLNQTKKPIYKQHKQNPIKRKNVVFSMSSGATSSSDEFTKAVKWAKTLRAKKKRKMCVKKSSVGKKYKTRRAESSDSMDSSSNSSISSSSEGDSSSSNTVGEERDKKDRKKHKKGKQIKSGVKAKAHKIRLKTSELCAQAVLDAEHCPGSYALEDLTFNQLVAGELEICTTCEVSKKEKHARLRILKLLAYFACILPQIVLIEIYKAVILKIEKGLFTWSSEIVKKAESMLDRAVSKNKLHKENENKRTEKVLEKQMTEKNKERKKELGLMLKSGERVVYCTDYNRQKCEKESVHEGKFAGRDVVKHHICKACLTIDKEKRHHPENDDKCPNTSA